MIFSRVCTDISDSSFTVIDLAWKLRLIAQTIVDANERVVVIESFQKWKIENIPFVAEYPATFVENSNDRKRLFSCTREENI